jgi:hypothetical protein
MTAPYTGTCACGAVTATIAAEPVGVRQCWCRQCQQIAGGSHTTNAIFPTESITLSGEVAAHGYLAASGNTLTGSFCPQCGTPVFAQSSARPHLRTFRVGFLDQGHGLKPQMVIWAKDAPDWAVFPEGLERFEAQPPPPPTPSAS